MIDQRIAYCYGIIVDDKTGSELSEIFYENNLDCLIQQIDSWTGGDWFIGFWEDLMDLTDSNDNVIKAEISFCFRDYEQKEMEKIKSILIEKGIDWKPEKYFIHFVY